MSRRIVIVLIIAGVIVLLCIFQILSSKSGAPTVTVAESAVSSLEETINEYISFLARVYENDPDKIFCSNAGMAPEFDLYCDQLDEPVAIEIRYGMLFSLDFEEALETQYTFAREQHETVIGQFGEDAWDNVEYEIETVDPIDPIEGNGGYRTKSTGEPVDEDRYKGIVNLYWLQVAQKEGVDLDDVLLKEGEDPEAISGKRADIIAKYIDDLPVECVAASDETLVDVKLRFNGKYESDEGYSAFHFTITGNEIDGWIIWQGLSWNEPISESPDHEV